MGRLRIRGSFEDQDIAALINEVLPAISTVPKLQGMDDHQAVLITAHTVLSSNQIKLNETYIYWYYAAYALYWMDRALVAYYEGDSEAANNAIALASVLVGSGEALKSG